MDVGRFVISLDFELQYGIEDKNYIDRYKEHILGGRKAIDELLQLFAKYEIHATWAVVGMLFNENLLEWKSNIPDYLPSYNRPVESIYDHQDRIGNNEKEDPLHFGFSLIKKIKETKYQEIGTHTYSHFYCCESGKQEAFIADIKKASDISKQKIGERPYSIIFPRNQINKDIVGILNKAKLRVYRGCPNSIIYNSNSIIVRFIRLLDAYFGIVRNKTYFLEECLDDNIINVKASAFFRPFNSKLWFLEPLKIFAIKREMLDAAKRKKIYHLWWHPHNIGVETNKNIKQLTEILEYYTFLNKKYGMVSNSMKDIGEML